MESSPAREPVTTTSSVGRQASDACLIVVGTPTRFELGRVLIVDRRLTLGRGADADLTLTDSALSRLHAELDSADGAITLTDLKSRNGCFVNGKKVTQARLRTGDQVRLGATTLHVHAAQDLPEDPWPADALEQAGVGLWDYLVQAGTVRWSRQANVAFRLPDRSLPVDPVSLAALVHPAHRAALAAQLDAADEAGAVDFETLLSLGSHERWVRLRGQVHRDGQGRPVRITGTALEVTSAKEREQAVVRAALVFENLGDGVLVTNRDGLVVDLNSAAEKAFGLERERAKERDLFTLLGARQPEAVKAAALATVASAGRWTSELMLPTATGPRVFEAVGFALREGGDAVGAAWLFRDVSERRALEARLNHLDRLSSLGSMSAGIAHELNNPLSYVLANARFVFEKLHEYPDEDVREALADFIEGAHRIANIVGDLRAFSRADADLEMHPTDLGAVVESARKVTAKLVDSRAVFRAELGGVPLVEAYEPRLVQVLVNLLMNAAQAIPERPGQPGHITVRAFEADGGVALEVVDDGEGMPPDVQERVFDPFFTTRPVGFGAGLGLAVCHGLVAAMGGTLSVKSAPGQGTTFRVWLRVATASEAHAPTPLPFTEDEGKRRVLLVDDEPLVLKAMSRILKQHEVTQAGSVDAALDVIAKGGQFDVILCDLMMPGRTGMDLYEALQREAPGLADRIIFVTGGAFTERAETFLREVPNRQLVKPVDATVLRQVVRQVAGR